MFYNFNIGQEVRIIFVSANKKDHKKDLEIKLFSFMCGTSGSSIIKYLSLHYYILLVIFHFSFIKLTTTML